MTRKVVALLWLSALAAGCGGATFHNGIYSSDEARYRIAAPRGFERMEAGDNDLAFFERGAGTISVNTTCIDYEDVPLTALVNHLLFDTTERRFLLEETVTLDGRGARHALLQAEIDGVPIELELYVMKKDGCVIDFAHIRSHRASAEAREAFASFVASFSLLEVRPDV